LNWFALIPLGAQALFAILTIESLRRVALPFSKEDSPTSLVRDVWIPLILLVPALPFAWRIEGDVAGTGWMILGLPITTCIFAAATSLMVARQKITIDGFPLVAWTAAGLLLILLGAAHHLNVLVAQCAFAIAALLMWWNTPDPGNNEDDSSDGNRKSVMAVLCALLTSVGHAISAFYVLPSHGAISGGMIVIVAAMAIALAARTGGPTAAIYIGGWTATYGLLIGVGMLSMIQLMPEALRRITGDAHGRAIYRVAYGFGEYWIEAIALLCFGVAAMALSRQHRIARMITGCLLLAAGAALAAWRLARMM
jgi:hypothetical protein